MEVFGDAVLTYEKATDLRTVGELLWSEPSADRENCRRLARHVMQNHSFEAWAERILSVVLDQDRRKMGFFPAPIT